MSEEHQLVTKPLRTNEDSKDVKIINRRCAYVYGNSTDPSQTINLDDYLIDLLQFNGELSPSQMVEITKIPRSTLYDALARLIKNGKIVKLPKHKKKRGRPTVVYSLPSR